VAGVSEWERTTADVDGPRVRPDVRDALHRYATAHGLEAALNASPLAAVETVSTRLEGHLRKREHRTYHLLWLTDELLVMAVVREEGERPSVHAFRLGEIDLDSSLAGFAASVGLADAYADGIPLTGLPLGGSHRGSYFLPAARGPVSDRFRERLHDAMREAGNPTAG
jgi:hypothetical protein